MKSVFGLLAAIGTFAALSFPSATNAKDLQRAILAGGCFWCVEKDFDQVRGVVKTTSGYIGGTTKNPTYKGVTQGGTGHFEAVEIIFDADIIEYDQLLYVYWRTIDPIDAGGQFCDRGASYRTAIFPTSPQQSLIASQSLAEVDKSGVLPKKVATQILPAGQFTPAETAHQDYYKKNPARYKFYRWNCGRDQRVRQLWGDQAINS